MLKLNDGIVKLPKLKFEKFGILNVIGENEFKLIEFNDERLLKILAMQDENSALPNGLPAFNAFNIYGFIPFIDVIKFNSPK